MISLFVLFISWLAVVDRWQCGAIGLLGTLEFMEPPPPSSSLVSCMKLASCPGQGLCLSHARLDPRHFITLTLPPTVTAALNEATHMCSDQVGQEPGVQLNAVGWTLAHRCCRALYGFTNVCIVLLSHRSEGPHSVSSRDNGVPSLTTVRITEHNRGSAAVMPAQGKQQEAVVVDSAVMKLAVTLPLWPPQHIYSGYTYTRKMIGSILFRPSFYKHLIANLSTSFCPD